MRPSHWALRHRLRGSSELPPKSPIPLRLTIQVPTYPEDIDLARELVDEWGRGFVAETDYRYEAANTAAFSEAMTRRGLGAVTSPTVVGELSTNCVPPRSKQPPWRRPSSAPVPPRAAPAGPVQLGTPRGGPRTTGTPTTRLGGSSEPPPKSPMSFHRLWAYPPGNTNIWMSDGPKMQFVLATYVHAYPNNVCSVWVYVASLHDMRAGATASVD